MSTCSSSGRPASRIASIRPSPLRRSETSSSMALCAAASALSAGCPENCRIVERGGEILDRIAAGAKNRDAPVRARTGQEAAVEIGQETGADERGFAAAGGADHGDELVPTQTG